MDKEGKRNKQSNEKVDSKKISEDHEDYGYDFIPDLDEWLNIDEQREKTEELEDI